MHRHFLQRRQIVTGLAAASLLPWQRVLPADGQLLSVTPSDVEGPFYPVEIPTDSDNDLLRVMSEDTLSPGQLAYVRGKVMGPTGKTIDGARVEIWQCDNEGVYHHPDDKGTPDKRFQGFGAMVTNRAGEYHFRTLRPVPYIGRTPHIHYRVTAEGFDRLTTQLYVKAESELNGKDDLYNRHPAEARALLTRAFSPVSTTGDGPVTAEFNIVLG